MSGEPKRRLCSMNLIRYLSRLLSRLVAFRLPDVETELSLSLDDVTRRLKQPPSPKFDDPSSELVDIVFEFTGAVSGDVRGVALSEDATPSLMQGIRMAQI
ncbi:hypothetical protein JB92DRAFT_3119322 [Gautieria morchelliformis]|nr:hypothetical protein JB92DRAFT_3119322 [Gautieria morchelliformis]